MAGNKVNTKTKGKEDKSKAKNVSQTSEETEDTDFSLLRKPIHTTITGFGQARKIFDLATEELKDLLSNECDLLYECKVCRNLFRSLANFISHKRIYCKEKFNTSTHSHFINATSTYTELLKIKRLEQGYQDSLKESIEIENKETDDVDDRVPLTKDLTAIVEKIAQNKGVKENGEEPVIALQTIPNTTVAVFQSVHPCEDKQKENMKAQVNELDKILSRDIAVLQSDGNFKIQSSVSEELDNVIQISDDEENSDNTNILKCKVCDMQFSTTKTLKFHMKYKHVESRLVYPCPDCLEIFSTSWSVYRHLFKVHRKTAAQIRRLRESIQAKAFKMNNPPAFYEKRKNNMKAAAAQKISEEERLEQENQAWMDNMEGDGELPRCGGCGRTFERRAALAAHTHTCQPRSRALSRRPQETKKIEIQIRKDYHKGPPVNLNLPVKTTDANENKINKDEPQIAPKPSTEEEKQNTEKEIEVVDEDKDDDKDDDDEDTPMDVSDDDTQSNDAIESPEKESEKPQIEPPKFNIRLPFAHQAEKSNLTAFRQRIISEIEVSKLLCKKCDVQFSETQELYDHVAEHVKWLRYACKLCNYKHYFFDKLPEHVKVVHKLKGDKDFYYSTVKAIDGTEALELCESSLELPDANGTSPESRRPSRCSSDSSRLSDDSSSSSTRIEAVGGKRKILHNKSSAKKRKVIGTKVAQDKDGVVSLDKNNIENFTSSNIKNFEENSSDIDDIEIKKQLPGSSSVVSRRPVRRKTKPKNADFEYDLSNLLKMEAQGYRDSQTMASAKSTQNKKKVQEVQINYDNLNKDSCGALVTMSKKSVERAAAHIKTDFASVYPQKDTRLPNVFVRPMLPKIISRADKISPKKDNEDAKESPSPSPVKAKESSVPSPVKLQESPAPSPVKPQEFPAPSPVKVQESPAPSPAKVQESTAPNHVREATTPLKEVLNPSKIPIEEQPKYKDEVNVKSETNTKLEDDSKTEIVEKTVLSKEQSSLNLKNKLNELVKPKHLPSIVPLKFRRQSLEVMKNPIINKNITDFTKSGLKTKILVIKPINRNKDGKQTLNTPLKFQTIKLKDPNKRSSKDDQEQVVVVKVPKVECTISRSVTDVCNKSIEQLAPASSSKSQIDISTPTENENVNKTVENNNETPIVVLPNLEANNEPTDLEECASTSNDTEDPKVINSECDITDVTIIKEELPTNNDNDTSENVDTTV